jgi:hypothetical protein
VLTHDTVEEYLTQMRAAGRQTGRPPCLPRAPASAARLRRRLGPMSHHGQIEAMAKASSFGSWLMVTAQIRQREQVGPLWQPCSTAA